ncbi:MAG: hypothetical protein Q9216_006951 [Gyalolechia sp. 2 TL-2023]
MSFRGAPRGRSGGSGGGRGGGAPRVDEILGPINQVHFTIKPQEGIIATSFKSGDKFYIGGDKLLPLQKFLPTPKPAPGIRTHYSVVTYMLIRYQVQLSLNVQVALQEVVPCEEVEEWVEVVAGERLEDEEDLEIGEEEEVLAEEGGVASVFAAAVAVVALKTDSKYDDYDYPTTSPNPQSGHPGHTTPAQDAQVFQLRTQLEQAGYSERLDTLSMLRFLRARKFNVDQAKQMFIDCEKWRKDFKVDDLVRNFDYQEKPKVFEYYPQYYHKTDKDGRPVYIEQLGGIDLTAMYKITTGERMLQNLVVEYEKLADPRLPACSRKSGQLLETSCSIMDLKGVGLSKVSSVYGYVKQVSAISQNYYPERLGKLYMINAPWGFSGVFSVVKGFLDPVTVGKIHILGTGYQSELLAQVPKENLPKMFGGTCDCEGSCALSDAGPWQDPQWAKAPKWADSKPEASQTIDNEPSNTIPTHDPKQAPPPTSTPQGAGAKEQAPMASS